MSTSIPAFRVSALASALLCLLALSACAEHAQHASKAPSLGGGEQGLIRPGQLSPKVALTKPSYRPEYDWARIDDAVFNGQDWVAVYESPLRLTRISNDGKVRDVPGRVVDDERGFNGQGALASDGLVTAMVSYRDSRAHFQRYDRELQKVGPELELSKGTAWAQQVAVAYGSGQYLAVWSHGDETSGAVYAARVSAAGVLLDTTPLQLATTTYAIERPDVVWDGERFFVHWVKVDPGNNRNGIIGLHVKPDGQLAAPAATLLAKATSADVCFGQGQYTVFWSDQTARTFVGHYSKELAPLGAQPSEVNEAESTGRDVRCTAVASGTLLGWSEWADEKYRPRLRMLSTAGELSAPFSLGNAHYEAQNPVVLASDGSGALALLQDHGSRISATGEVLDERIVAAVRLVSPSFPALALAGDVGLAVYGDTQEGPNDLRAQHVTRDGQLVDEPWSIALPNLGDYRYRIASDGKGYLIVWYDASQNYPDFIRALHLGLDGRPDSEVLTIAERPDQIDDIALVASPQGYLFVCGQFHKVWARRFASDGTPEGKQLVLARPDKFNEHVGAAYDGERYMVAWYSESDDTLRMNRVSMLGELLYAETEPRVITTQINFGERLALAVGGGGAYVLGEAGSPGVWFDLAGNTPHPQGKSLPMHLAVSSVVYDGGGFTVVGSHYDGDASAFYAMRVDGQGVAMGDGLAITREDWAVQHAVAATSDGSLLLVHEQEDPELMGTRLYVRTLGPRSTDVEYDGGLPDAGDQDVRDGGTVDTPDSAQPQQEPDAGDTGAPTGPRVDGGSFPAEGEHDGGALTSGDAGAGDDGQVPGSTGDAGTPTVDPFGAVTDSGCSCRTSASAPPYGAGLWSLVVGLSLARRRRGARVRR